ncbi:amidase family protein [Gammaproteobacteria bacterium]|nr:amidase family protein [Gammaproteobacteria bacterium]
MDELIKKGAVELGRLIKNGETSSEEVVKAHLERIKEVNPDINAITISLEESALELAVKSDNASKEEKERPLHGVPFTVKENIDFIGLPTTNGLPFFAEEFPPKNAPIVDRMLNAGAIPIGRTNLPEMGLRLDTDNPLRGRTFNPWNKKLTPGGSSGGEAAAIATGMSPIGLGNDVGGSLRNPAYCCGISSIKPTVGRVPGVYSGAIENIGLIAPFMTDGPMARKVEDIKAGLSILAGRHIDDPNSVDVPLEGKIPEKFKAALVKEIDGIELPPATVKEIEEAGKILSENGWDVEEVQAPELDKVYDIWGVILSEGGMQLAPKELFKPETAAYLDRVSETFSHINLSMDEKFTERFRLRKVWSNFLNEYQVCIGPTWCNLPWQIDTDLNPKLGDDALKKSFYFIAPANGLGLPAVALATGVSEGIPTGIQIYADLFRDDLALLAAEIIEKEKPCPSPINPN